VYASPARASTGKSGNRKKTQFVSPSGFKSPKQKKHLKYPKKFSVTRDQFKSPNQDPFEKISEERSS